jgi:hypothetical protein
MTQVSHHRSKGLALVVLLAALLTPSALASSPPPDAFERAVSARVSASQPDAFERAVNAKLSAPVPDAFERAVNAQLSRPVPDAFERAVIRETVRPDDLGAIRGPGAFGTQTDITVADEGGVDWRTYGALSLVIIASLFAASGLLLVRRRERMAH